MDDFLTMKQEQFNAAMKRYDSHSGYRLTGMVVSFANVSLQAALAFLAFSETTGAIAHVLAFAVAFVLADLVNGWVHLYMDNCDNYESAAGPFFASFHLHHRTPRYKRRPIIVVYYHESGSKLWLVVVQLAFILGITLGVIKGALAWGAFYF